MIAVLRDVTSGVVDMSPDSYDRLSGTDRNVINQWIQRFAQADMMAKNINAMLSNRHHPRKRSRNRR